MEKSVACKEDKEKERKRKEDIGPILWDFLRAGLKNHPEVILLGKPPNRGQDCASSPEERYDVKYHAFVRKKVCPVPGGPENLTGERYLAPQRPESWEEDSTQSSQMTWRSTTLGGKKTSFKKIE